MSIDATTFMGLSDFTLLSQFTETGDAAAFAEIVKRYARVVYSASIRILGDDAKAQDVSQETFFRLMRQPRIVTHSLGGWLHRSATHLAMDVRRSEKSRKQREITYVAEQQITRQNEPTWAELSPYVDEALNAVQEPTRSLLIRHFLQGVPQTDLAKELSTSPATISRRIKTGVEQLQEQLRKKGVYVGVAALACFCMGNTTEAAPTAFLSELGKMNLVASLRSPINPVPTPSVPRPQPTRTANPPTPHLTYVIPTKWLIAGLVLFLIAYTVVVIDTWQYNSQPSPQQQQQHTQTEP
jgi:RNA polymerase sigma-70 factor (ECF subfamily)